MDECTTRIGSCPEIAKPKRQFFCRTALSSSCAATRVAWSGGFGLDDPEVLVAAAAAAGLGLGDALDAGGDVSRDGPMDATAERLLAAGGGRPPPPLANPA